MFITFRITRKISLCVSKCANFTLIGVQRFIISRPLLLLLQVETDLLTEKNPSSIEMVIILVVVGYFLTRVATKCKLFYAH